MMEKDAKIYVAGHRGMVGSAIVRELRRQVKFILIPAQREPQRPEGKILGKVVERECSYIADFVYTDRDGNTVVEDTKGVRTKEYVIKRKLMLERFGIRIVEI